MRPITIATPCACKGATLDRFIQPVILDILSRESCSGYQLIKKMEEYPMFEGAGPDPAGVYRYLKLMQGRGHIRRSQEEKPLFSITPEGKECLANWAATLREYARSVAELAERLEQR